ncbi:MAG: PHP domain-containing protein [Armatimonadota bacterium]
MLTSDWHIHSIYSCDGACLPMADLPDQAVACGITDFGITDHLHTPYNMPDIAASRAAYLATRPSARFHFGIEVSVVSQWELDEVATGKYQSPTYGLRQGGPAGGALGLALTEEDIRTYGIEFVVGGTHWPMYVPFEREAIIRDYHRQNMFLATHPLVTIIAHPWWWMGYWMNEKGMYPAEPWFDTFAAIPMSMHDEFAAAARAHGKVVEINLSAMLLTPHYPAHFAGEYLDYLAGLHARGVPLSIGSDCHDPQYTIDFPRAAEMLASVGIGDQDLWRLPPRTA